MLPNVYPKKLKPIVPDGNCLFRCFSFFLFSAENEHSYLRKFICQNMHQVPFSPLQFLAHSMSENPSYCVEEYLSKEKISLDGIFAGDIEISSFCYLFNAQVVVFVPTQGSQKWFIYDNFSRANCAVFFLRLQGNHFEPILDVNTEDPDFMVTAQKLPKSVEELYINQPATRKRKNLDFVLPAPNEKKCFQSRNLKTKKQSNFSVENQKVPFSGSTTKCFQIDKIFPTPVNELYRIFDGEPCCKCRRVSTKWYPLTFFSFDKDIDLSNCKSRKFGCKLSKSSKQLCENCFRYVTSDKTKWSDAWPSVLFSKFIRTGYDLFKVFFFKFPIQLQMSWFFYRLNNKFKFEQKPIFNDITRDIVEFERLINTFKSIDFKTCLNRYPFPSVRCFCGASEFIDEVGFIDFKHVINYLDPNFTSFDSDWTKFVKCMRSDYFDDMPHYLVFECSPSIVVFKSGLQICTCKLHRFGSNLNMCHAPRHPKTGNLSHPQADRFAPLVSTIRGAKATKIGEFSNTFFMSTSVGGRNGVGSMTLHENRNLNAKSDYLLPVLESTYINNRKDANETLSSMAKEHNLSSSLVESFRSTQYQPQFDEIKKAMKSATYVPIKLIEKIKNFFDETNLDEDECVRNPGEVGILNFSSEKPARPFFSRKSLFKLNYNIALLTTVFFNLLPIQYFLWEINNELASQLRLFWKTSGVKLELKIQRLLTLLEVSENESFVSFWLKICHRLGWHFLSDFDVCADKNLAIRVSERNSLQIGHDSFLHDFDMCFQEKRPCRASFNMCFTFLLPEKTNVFINSTTGEQIHEKFIPNVFHKSRLQIFLRKQNNSVCIDGFFSGQNRVKCSLHSLFLTIDYKRTRFFCSAAFCKLKSKWRCPHEKCCYCLCCTHFEENSPVLKSNFSFYSSVENDNNQQDLNDEQYEFLSISDDPIDEFVGPMCAEADYVNQNIDTDAGLESVPIECDEDKDLYSIPIQLIFNIFLSVLHRRKNPIDGNLKFKRFIQGFSARNRVGSISLLQLESLLFPSIFYVQMSDGSSPGALPCFLYTSEKQCRKLGFSGLLEHFRTRLTDVSLPTSGSFRYIQYVCDCLVNLNLKDKHSQEFFTRGIQSLKLYDRDVLLFSKINFHLNDTEQCVRQLSTALRSKMVTFFLTITCNQKKHPGVGPLLDAIENFFRNSAEEVKKEAVNAYMVTLVRCWSRSVKYFINLLTYSSENLLGSIEKIWGRAEFQTTTGNLPHYHILVWSKSGTYDRNKLIQCSEKAIFSIFKEMFETNVDFFSSTEDMIKKYDDCVRIHTHSCEKSRFRCMKRKDLNGDKICRTPPYPPSHHHWKMEITQQYPKGSLDYLFELGLAKKVNNSIQVTEQLRCEKWMYAASSGEHILPTNVKMFLINESSVNLLLCTGLFACNYLTRYCGKNEEHANSEISSSQDGKSFRLRNEGIENKSLASVKFVLNYLKRTEKKREHIKCQLLAITESVFWSLGEPYVFTNMTFIHIQNVPCEKRFVCQGSNVNLFSVQMNKTNFRDWLPNLPDYRKVTLNQKTLMEDASRSIEHLDFMSAFSLRPPELLVVSNVSSYFRFFSFSNSKTASQLLAMFRESSNCLPWISCTGCSVFLRASAVHEFRQFLSVFDINICPLDVTRRNAILDLLDSDCQSFIVFDSKDLLPEIVFRFNSPRDSLTFLVGFLLRFGYFHTELDLFNSSNLLDSFVNGNCVSRKEAYTQLDVDQLVKTYFLKDLFYQPGSNLSKCSKLLLSRIAFSQLLNIDSSDIVPTPIVLINNLHYNIRDEVATYLQKIQDDMMKRINNLGLTNLPENTSENTYWEPNFQIGQFQQQESFEEQRCVLNKLISAINIKFSSSEQVAVKHQIILG